MNKKVYLVALFFILFVSISSLAYMQIKISNLEHKNMILKDENTTLKNSISKLYKKFQYFSNDRVNGNKIPDTKPNIIPHRWFGSIHDSFGDIDKQFQDMERQMQEMNNIFSNPNFWMHLKIDGSSPWSEISITKHFTINNKTFSYSINSSNWKISWTIKWDNKNILKDLQDSLEKLWLKTDIKNDTLSFSWEKIDVNKITWVIDDYIDKNYQPNELNPQKKENNNLVPWKDYF